MSGLGWIRGKKILCWTMPTTRVMGGGAPRSTLTCWLLTEGTPLKLPESAVLRLVVVPFYHQTNAVCIFSMPGRATNPQHCSCQIHQHGRPCTVGKTFKCISYGVTFFSKARLACMTDLKHPPDNWLRDDPATKGFVPPTQVSWLFNEMLRI